MEENNIFEFATKELSQDAFICWLVNSIKNGDKKVGEKGKSFLNYIFTKKGITVHKYETIEVLKQYKKIDILIIVNNKYFLIIEDKKFTGIHDEQIENYKNKIKKDKRYKEQIKDAKIITVYYKPYEELEEIYADVHIKRQDMLEKILIDDENIDNNIYIDYKKYLEEIENTVKKIREIPIKDWNKKKELLYKFAFDYNKKFSNKENNKKCRIQSMQGSNYVDWYLIENLKEKYNKMFKKMYLSLNINYELRELRVRGEVNETDKKLMYDEKIRNEVSKELYEEFSKIFNDKNCEIAARKKGKNINLLTINLDENIKYDKLEYVMKEAEGLLDKYQK